MVGRPPWQYTGISPAGSTLSRFIRLLTRPHEQTAGAACSPSLMPSACGQSGVLGLGGGVRSFRDTPQRLRKGMGGFKGAKRRRVRCLEREHGGGEGGTLQLGRRLPLSLSGVCYLAPGCAQRKNWSCAQRPAWYAGRCTVPSVGYIL